MTEKAIQLRWTDIEIRKYRLNDASSGYRVEATAIEDTLESIDLDEPA